MDIMDIKHLYQNTGNSCGPTCIKMAGDTIHLNFPEIDEICTICGTDWIVGTPPDRMKIGLDSLNINHIEHINELDPFLSLKNTIDNGNIAIVRTITNNIPHWILIYDYDNTNFFVNDPYLGKIKYNHINLDDIWKVRDYFYYEIIINNKPIIRQILPDDHDLIYNKLAEVYHKTQLTNNDIWEMISHFDENLSFVVTINSKLAGFYLIGRDQIPTYADTNGLLKNLTGVEGIALGVFNEYKDKGIGKLLITNSQKLNFDYIWGYQLKSLNNIDHWLKRRNIIYESEFIYITYQLLIENVN